MQPDEPDWEWDDPTIAADDVLYRRVPNRPSYFTTQNRFNGDICLAPGAFTLEQRDYAPPAGCSVQIESLMRALGITPTQLVNWETHVLGRFQVRNVREAGGGVVAVEDGDDDQLGKVHGLIRTKSPGMRPKAAWSELRSKLLDHVAYIGDPTKT